MTFGISMKVSKWKLMPPLVSENKILSLCSDHCLQDAPLPHLHPFPIYLKPSHSLTITKDEKHSMWWPPKVCFIFINCCYLLKLSKVMIALAYIKIWISLDKNINYQTVFVVILRHLLVTDWWKHSRHWWQRCFLTLSWSQFSNVVHVTHSKPDDRAANTKKETQYIK